MISAGSGVLDAFPNVPRTVNVCVSGPEVSLDGVFCVERYLADHDCIWHEGKWFSRSAFEKAAGSHTARWHCSIKVAGHPNKISIGAWLEENGLPVLKGGKRKSRSQRLREVQSRGGSPFADPTPVPTPPTDHLQSAPPLARPQPTTSPHSYHPPPTYPPQQQPALPHPHALHQLGLPGQPPHAPGNAPQSTLPVLPPSLGQATSLPHAVGPRPRHLSPALTAGSLPPPPHREPPAPHTTPQRPRRMPPDSTPGALLQPPNPQPRGPHAVTQPHDHPPSPFTRGSLQQPLQQQPPAVHAAPRPSTQPPTSHQPLAMPQHLQSPFRQPPSASLLPQHHQHHHHDHHHHHDNLSRHQAQAPTAAHPLLQLLQQHHLSPAQQVLVLRLLASQSLQPGLAGVRSHVLSPRPSTASVGVQTEPETDANGNGSSTRTTTAAATTSAQNPMSTSSAASDRGRAGQDPNTAHVPAPAPAPGYPPAAPPGHSNTAFTDHPHYHHRAASLPNASHLAPTHDPASYHPATGAFPQLQLPDARSLPQSLMPPAHRFSAPGRANLGGRAFGPQAIGPSYGPASDRGEPRMGDPLVLPYSGEGARGGPLPVGHEGAMGGPLPAGHESDRGGLILDLESDEAAAVLGLHLWEDAPTDAAPGHVAPGHVAAAYSGPSDAAWRHVAPPVGVAPQPQPAAAGLQLSGGATDAFGGRNNTAHVTMDAGASSGAAASVGHDGQGARAMYGGNADPSVGSTRSG